MEFAKRRNSGSRVMPTKFPGFVETCVWMMPDQFRIEHQCRVKTQDMLTTIDVHFLSLDVKDADLGADILLEAQAPVKKTAPRAKKR
jgi:hypothetical protein